MMIDTSRLELRLWGKSDAASLFEIAKDEDVAYRTGWNPHKNVEESQSILETILMDGHTFKMIRKQDRRIIGCVSIIYFNQDDPRHQEQSIEIGYYLGKEYWGNGYMPEAVRAVIQYAFEQLHVKTIWCGHFDFNNQSKRVIEKVGFAYHHTDYEVKNKITQHVVNIVQYVLEKENWKNV